jgi:hypothetical protein
MFPSLAATRVSPGLGDPRPIYFLVSTTNLSGGIRESLGHAAYSYVFVLETLAPVLEQLGTWRRIEHPESSLHFAADQAEAEGYRPVHLILRAPHDAYLAPGIPNILFPFWEFPNIPDRDICDDTRQNWKRIGRHADLIVTACEFTAEAFRRAVGNRPVAVVPVPIPPRYFDMPIWDPEYTWTITCRHLIWGSPETLTTLATTGEPVDVSRNTSDSAVIPEPTAPCSMSWTRRVRRGLRATALRMEPWLSPGVVTSGYQIERQLRRGVGHLRRWRPGASRGGASEPGSWRRRGFMGLRKFYRARVRPWLSDEAIERVTSIKRRMLRTLGLGAGDVRDPLLPSTPLTISGLVYTSMFNLGDRRKNELDLLSAFLLAFRDRPDVTLLIKLVTNPACEFHELKLLRKMYEALGLTHQCRVVVITEFLDDAAMDGLMRATTYYVNTSRAEGACLPLQQSLAAGRPGLAPNHTAMADFMDNTVGFVIGSHPEPTYWPHDPEKRTATYWNRLVWSDLYDRFRESAEIIDRDSERYRSMSEAARRRMTRTASRPIVTAALRRALELLPEPGQEVLARAS